MLVKVGAVVLEPQRQAASGWGPYPQHFACVGSQRAAVGRHAGQQHASRVRPGRARLGRGQRQHRSLRRAGARERQHARGLRRRHVCQQPLNADARDDHLAGGSCGLKSGQSFRNVTTRGLRRRCVRQPPLNVSACHGCLSVGNAGSSLGVPVSKRPGVQLKAHAAWPARVIRMSSTGLTIKWSGQEVTRTPLAPNQHVTRVYAADVVLMHVHTLQMERHPGRCQVAHLVDGRVWLRGAVGDGARAERRLDLVQPHRRHERVARQQAEERQACLGQARMQLLAAALRRGLALGRHLRFAQQALAMLLYIAVYQH